MAIDVRLGQRLEAVPVHTPVQYSRLSLDPRLAKEFLQSSSVSPSTKAELTQYIVTSKWSSNERAIYGAVVEGFASIEELKTVTGLPQSKVQKVVGKLEKKGVLRKVSEV